jgi:hypothetical protein
MLRTPHCLDNRLTDGSNIVSPKHRPLSTFHKHYFSVSGTHFCLGLSKPHGLMRPEGLGKLKKKKKFINLIWSQTRNLPACRIVPQPLCYHVPLVSVIGRKISNAEDTTRKLMFLSIVCFLRVVWDGHSCYKMDRIVLCPVYNKYNRPWLI